MVVHNYLLKCTYFFLSQLRREDIAKKFMFLVSNVHPDKL